MVLTTGKKIFHLLNVHERWQFLLIVLAVVVMGFTHVAGVGLIIPFASMLLNPAILDQNDHLHIIYTLLEFQQPKAFMLFLGTGVLIVLVLGNLWSALTVWLMTRFVWRFQYQLSLRLLSRYLAEDYLSLTSRTTAEIVRNVLFESVQLSNGVLMPLMKIMSSGITIMLITGVLVLINPGITLGALIVFGAGYVFIYFFIRHPLNRMGKRRRDVYKTRLKHVSEAFGSIKEVKVLGRESGFISRFRPSARIAASVEVKYYVLTQLPKYFIETLAFGFVMLVLLFVLNSDAELSRVLPIAVAFLYAAFRLLPAIQVAYKATSALRFNRSVLSSVHSDLTDGTLTRFSVSPNKLRFNDRLQLNHVSYSYPDSDRPAISDLSCEIRQGEFVAFVGATGSGKTTLTDLILGVLVPTSGNLIVDGQVIDTSDLSCWQRSFGFVPQEIYLLDDTVIANIAFGVLPEAVDIDAVKRAARMACIDEFIEESLPQGYSTSVGERGVRLSGGQRQRLGLARALYHDPPILVLDEATSALDGTTEAIVQKELLASSASKTVIAVAHRLASIQDCDRIFLLDGGKLIDQGTYQELMARSHVFRDMARASEVHD